jgi:hypothetical protein
MNANANGPKGADFFEVEGGVAWVLFELVVAAIGQGLYFDGELSVVIPEVWGGTMFHRSVQRPAWRCWSARAARWSRRPAATSFSSFWSQAWASNSVSQVRRWLRSSGDS